jgi:hypothetical protein
MQSLEAGSLSTANASSLGCFENCWLERRYRNPVSTSGLAKPRASANEETGFLAILNRCSRGFAVNPAAFSSKLLLIGTPFYDTGPGLQGYH